MTIQIPLSQGFFAIVDDADAWIADFKWWAGRAPNGGVYANRIVPSDKTRSRQTTLPMHRAILGDACIGMVVDHIDGDGLNNRRSNLRAVTRQTNVRNVAGAYASNKSSGILGVSWHKRDKRWRAQIRVDGRKINLGNFVTIEEAKAARLAAEAKFWGVEPRRAAAHGAAVHQSTGGE